MVAVAVSAAAVGEREDWAAVRPCKRWTEQEDAYLRAHYPTAASRREIAAIGLALGKSPQAVGSRAQRLGVFRGSRRWTLSQEDYLRSHYHHYDPARIAAHLGRTTYAVRRRAWLLGLSRPGRVTTLTEIARRYYFSRSAVWKWIRQGYVKAEYTRTASGRIYRYDIDEESVLRHVNRTRYYSQPHHAKGKPAASKQVVGGHRQRTVPAGRKWCSGCKRSHPLCDFYADRRSGDGKQGTCKAWQSRLHRAYYARNTERCRQTVRRWQKAQAQARKQQRQQQREEAA